MLTIKPSSVVRVRMPPDTAEVDSAVIEKLEESVEENESPDEEYVSTVVDDEDVRAIENNLTSRFDAELEREESVLYQVSSPGDGPAYDVLELPVTTDAGDAVTSITAIAVDGKVFRVRSSRVEFEGEGRFRLLVTEAESGEVTFQQEVTERFSRLESRMRDLEVAVDTCNQRIEDLRNLYREDIENWHELQTLQFVETRKCRACLGLTGFLQFAKREVGPITAVTVVGLAIGTLPVSVPAGVGVSAVGVSLLLLGRLDEFDPSVAGVRLLGEYLTQKRDSREEEIDRRRFCERRGLCKRQPEME